MKLPHKWMSDSYRTSRTKFLGAMILIVYWPCFVLLLAPLFLLGFVFGAIGNWDDVIIPVLVLSVLPSWWFSRIAAHHMGFGDQSFKIASQNTFYPIMVKLAFLPIVGPHFERFISRAKNQNPFVAEGGEK